MKTLFEFLKRHFKAVLIVGGVFLCIMIVGMLAGGEEDSYTPEGTDSVVSSPSSHPSSWSIKDYTDEFGMATGEKYVKTYGSGTFSDTVATDQNLRVEVQAFPNGGVRIILWEYGTSQLEALFDSTAYNITVLDQNGEKHKFTSFLQDGYPYLAVLNYSGDGLWESSADMINIFKSGGSVKFHIVNSDDKDNTYSFSIEADGFAKLYETILSASKETES